MGLKCVPIPNIAPALELPDRCLQNARIVAERSDILSLLPKGGAVAEVGVAFGLYSRKIIDRMQPEHFVAIDTFELDQPSWSGRQAYKDVLGNRSHEAFYKETFADEIEAGRLSIKTGFSHEMLDRLPDCHFDMIYIDAAHDYESVRQDLEVAIRKINERGTLILNDYTLFDPLLLQPYGIVHATHELCINEGWEIVYLALHRYMFCDVALRKINS
jgi:hypothetical protein